MSGRLPGLTQGKPSGASSLKFRPKAVARKTKDERDANALKVEEPKKPSERKKYTQKPQNAQKRQPKYLNNTKVITSGPLAAGNFSGGSSKGANAFIKTEGSESSLLQKGLKAVSDDEADGSDLESGAIGKRINMGKEYTAEDFKKETDDLFEEEDVESPANGDIDEETMVSKQLASLFPVRAVRINHDNIDTIQRAVQQSLSSANTRDPTPGPVKLEQEHSTPTLPDIMREKEEELKEKLRLLQLQQDYQCIDVEEGLRETNLLREDHRHIFRKLKKINDTPNKFMFFQFPSNLPEFKSPVQAQKQEPVPEKQASTENSDANEEKGKSTDKDKDTNKTKPKKAPNAEPDAPLVGNVGSLRVHESGRMSVKIGNVIMDISRGAESTFLQDVVTLDLEDEEAELMGLIDGRAIVTPRI